MRVQMRLLVVLAAIAAVVAEGHDQCVCKPQMKLEWSPEVVRQPLCNNATMEWLLQTVMMQLSKQDELVTQQQLKLAELQESLQKKDAMIRQMEDKNKALAQAKEKVYDELTSVKAKANDITSYRPRDCSDVQLLGAHISGIFTVFPEGAKTWGIDVYCDLKTDGGGWTVIQRRQDGSEDFYRGWQKYKWGFGTLNKEFWIGNQKIYWLTHDKEYELRIEMTDFDKVKATASYNGFSVDDEENEYTLRLGQFAGGDAGDALSHHSGHPFSTHDSDKDSSTSGNCSKLYGGAWWYVRCYDSNLNGIYTPKHARDAIIWYQWRKNHTPIKHVEMKIRPVTFRT